MTEVVLYFSWHPITWQTILMCPISHSFDLLSRHLPDVFNTKILSLFVINNYCITLCSVERYLKICNYLSIHQNLNVFMYISIDLKDSYILLYLQFIGLDLFIIITFSVLE